MLNNQKMRLVVMKKFASLSLTTLAVCVAVVSLGAQSAGPVAKVSQGGTRASVARVFGWRTVISADLFPHLTVLELAEKAKQLSVQAIEVSSSQIVSQEIPKKLDVNLSPSDLELFKKRFAELREGGERLEACRLQGKSSGCGRELLEESVPICSRPRGRHSHLRS